MTSKLISIGYVHTILKTIKITFLPYETGDSVFTREFLSAKGRKGWDVQTHGKVSFSPQFGRLDYG